MRLLKSIQSNHITMQKGNRCLQSRAHASLVLYFNQKCCIFKYIEFEKLRV